MAIDVIHDGAAHGGVAQRLLKSGGDVSVLRPWVGNDGRAYQARLSGFETGPNGKRSPKYEAVRTNTDATLRKDDWIRMDEAILRVAKPRLNLVADLRREGLEFNIPNGFAYSVLQYEDMSDISRATISMDGLRRADSDRPVFSLKNLPLPIVHHDFHFSARQLAVSQRAGTPLDTSTGELAAIRVAEEMEALLAGTAKEFTYGGGTIFGYTNFPSRLTMTISSPDGTDHTHDKTINEILQMVALAQDNNHYGPFWLYYGRGWTVPMGEDYFVTGGNNPNQTLQQRMLALPQIRDVRLADFLPKDDLVLVEINSTVVRVVVGMEIQTVQWEEQGGGQFNFKVMGIMVPQLRADQLGQTGIVHGTFAAA